VIVYCRSHARALGVVRRNPVGGFVEFKHRDARFRDRDAQEWGMDAHDTSFVRLDEWTRPMVESRGCRDCGVRDLPVAALVEAFEEDRAKVAF
jgi:hypothetical protein